MNPTPSGVQLERDKTIIASHPFLTYIQKRRPREAPSLLMFYVPFAQRWCLAKWKNKIAGRVQILQTWGPGESPTYRDVDFIEYFLTDQRRIDALNYLKRSASKERDWRRDRSDESAENFQRWDRRRRGRIFAPVRS